MPKGVRDKLFAILKELNERGTIPKEGNNQEQGYRYLSERQIKELMQDLLVKHGLLFFPFNQRILSSEKSPKGTQRVIDVEVMYAWVDVETGELVEGRMIGTGADFADKGTYKALTGACKQVMCNTFQIPSGDDPEKGDQGRTVPRVQRTQARSKQDPESVISQGQQQRIFALASAAGVHTSRVKEIVYERGYTSSKDILVKDYDSICQKIESEGGQQI